MADEFLSQRISGLPEELRVLENMPEIASRLSRVDELREQAASLKPLDGVEDMALTDYSRDWLVRYTYNSNAIEGSTLTLEDTSLVLRAGSFPRIHRPDTCSRHAASRMAWPTCANTPRMGGSWTRNWSVASTK